MATATTLWEGTRKSGMGGRRGRTDSDPHNAALMLESQVSTIPNLGLQVSIDRHSSSKLDPGSANLNSTNPGLTVKYRHTLWPLYIALVTHRGLKMDAKVRHSHGKASLRFQNVVKKSLSINENVAHYVWGTH